MARVTLILGASAFLAGHYRAKGKLVLLTLWGMAAVLATTILLLKSGVRI